MTLPLEICSGIRHGTNWSYCHHGCRCDPCRDAHRRAAQFYGTNVRSGKRGEAKRRWDDENRSVCACGAACSRKTDRCQECAARAKHEAQQARDARIAEMWADGLTRLRIAVALGSTSNSVGSAMHRMRREGWDLPYRYAMKAGKRVSA